MLSVYEVDPGFFFLYWGSLGVLLMALVVVTIKCWEDVRSFFWPTSVAVALAFFALWRWAW